MIVRHIRLFSEVSLLAAAMQASAEDNTNHMSVAIPAQTNSIQVSANSTNTPSKPELPVLGYVESRDRVITLKAGPNGTIYSCRTKDGKVLFENLSAEQLRAQSPELGDFVKSAVAGGKDHKGAILDGRLDASGR
jgi:hypothetical protein